MIEQESALPDSAGSAWQLASGGSAEGRGFLVFFHCPSNTGYAIGRLERVFLAAAKHAGFKVSDIHFAYTDLSGGIPAHLDCIGDNVCKINPWTRSRAELDRITDLAREKRVEVAVGFDQQPKQAIYRALRKGGTRRIVSYWGAPMSSLNSGLRLLAKRLDAWSDFWGPDAYVFESKAMQLSGQLGRGIRGSIAHLVPLGVDTGIFFPPAARTDFAHISLGIPKERAIIIYSGHMEPRKGVDVILRAATSLLEGWPSCPAHFLLCGDATSDMARLRPIFEGTPAESHITFAGYRSDMPALMREASIGVIASTGWDSFTMSAVEMAASGLPLVVSRLQGLQETVEDGSTGFLFPPGDHLTLANRLKQLLTNAELRKTLGERARWRAVDQFSIEKQVTSLAGLFRPSSKRD